MPDFLTVHPCVVILHDIYIASHSMPDAAGAPGVLFVYRWVCLLYITYVCIEQILRIKSLRIYNFYTVW